MNRHTAREEAFKILFEQDINKEDLSYEGMNNYTKIVVFGVSDNQKIIDETIIKSLQNWDYDRIALVERTILRIAVFEIMYLDEIPVSVSINEAVELSHKYGDEKSGKFVNGVLSYIIEERKE